MDTETLRELIEIARSAPSREEAAEALRDFGGASANNLAMLYSDLGRLDEAAEREVRRLGHSEELTELSSTLHSAVYGADGALVESLGGLSRKIDDLLRIDPGASEIAELTDSLEEKLKRLELTSLFMDPRDSKTAILSIHPGAGGTDEEGRTSQWSAQGATARGRWFQRRRIHAAR